MYLWMQKNRTSVGIMPSVAAAIRPPQSVPYCCMKDWMRTGIVITVSSRRNTLEVDFGFGLAGQAADECGGRQGQGDERTRLRRAPSFQLPADTCEPGPV
jgi:hypothetical protein